MSRGRVWEDWLDSLDSDSFQTPNWVDDNAFSRALQSGGLSGMPGGVSFPLTTYVASGPLISNYLAKGDANPSGQLMAYAGLKAGPGGASPLDTTFTWAGSQTWQASQNINAVGSLGCGNGAAIGGHLWSGSGVPAAGLGANGDYYFRTDTPGTVGQRIYVKSAGAWVATAA